MGTAPAMTTMLIGGLGASELIILLVVLGVPAAAVFASIVWLVGRRSH